MLCSFRSRQRTTGDLCVSDPIGDQGLMSGAAFELLSQACGEVAQGVPAEDTPVRECLLCLDKPRAVRFHPCGHAVACEDCALNVIKHSQQRKLNCPTCKAVIQRFEVDRSDAPTPIARQKSFQMETHASLSVEEFMVRSVASADPSRKAAAAAAQQAWTADALWPVRNPMVDRAALLLICALAASFAWGLVCVSAAKAELDTYLNASEVAPQVITTSWAGFWGPVGLLLPACPEDAPMVAAAAAVSRAAASHSGLHAPSALRPPSTASAPGAPEANGSAVPAVRDAGRGSDARRP